MHDILEFLSIAVNMKQDLESSDYSEEVFLYEYDLFERKCFPRALKKPSRKIFGEVPHVSIVVHGREFQFESGGPCFVQCTTVNICCRCYCCLV